MKTPEMSSEVLTHPTVCEATLRGIREIVLEQYKKSANEAIEKLRKEVEDTLLNLATEAAKRISIELEQDFNSIYAFSRVEVIIKVADKKGSE